MRQLGKHGTASAVSLPSECVQSTTVHRFCPTNRKNGTVTVGTLAPIVECSACAPWEAARPVPAWGLEEATRTSSSQDSISSQALCWTFSDPISWAAASEHPFRFCSMANKEVQMVRCPAEFDPDPTPEMGDRPLSCSCELRQASHVEVT